MAKHNADMVRQLADLQRVVADLTAKNDQLTKQLVGGLGHGTRSAYSWQGHSLTGLVRAMSQRGWSGGAISQVLVMLGLPANPSTIQTQRQLAKGKPAKDGKPAVLGKPGPDLTPDQWAHLTACLSACRPAPFAPPTALPTPGPVPSLDGPDDGFTDMDRAS